MKLIIAGGRDFYLNLDHVGWLDDLCCVENDLVDEVVHGGATGADQGGKAWGIVTRRKVTPFPVLPSDWKTLGKRAGPLRNKAMAEYAGAYPEGVCALFPGGKGTASMKEEALKAGLRVYVYPSLEPIN